MTLLYRLGASALRFYARSFASNELVYDVNVISENLFLPVADWLRGCDHSFSSIIVTNKHGQLFVIAPTASLLNYYFASRCIHIQNKGLFSCPEFPFVEIPAYGASYIKMRTILPVAEKLCFRIPEIRQQLHWRGGDATYKKRCGKGNP